MKDRGRAWSRDRGRTRAQPPASHRRPAGRRGGSCRSGGSGSREGEAPAEPVGREGEAPAEPVGREGEAPAEPFLPQLVARNEPTPRDHYPDGTDVQLGSFSGPYSSRRRT